MNQFIKGLTSCLCVSIICSSCVSDDPGTPSDGYSEGVEYDSEYEGAFLGGGKEDGVAYEVPSNLPTLEAPEIIVSLDQLTVHIFDRETGFSEVYPAGVGTLNADNVSISPTGHFTTSPDTSDSWWYIARRYVPEVFGGFPFIRLTAENSRGQNTYGLHGPITQTLIRGYVSHGCVRMAGDDVVKMFYMIRRHASTPVTIQREPEVDAAGNVVDLGTEVTLWAPGDEIDYGSSVGDGPPRDTSGTDASGCADDRLESSDDVSLEPGVYQGLILCAADTDRYIVHLDAGQRVTVDMHFIHQISDMALRLHTPEGTILAESDEQSDDEQLEQTTETAGDYVIEVYRWGDGETNGYSLTVDVE